jgi:hypothetical protein
LSIQWVDGDALVRVGGGYCPLFEIVDKFGAQEARKIKKANDQLRLSKKNSNVSDNIRTSRTSHRKK